MLREKIAEHVFHFVNGRCWFFKEIRSTNSNLILLYHGYVVFLTACTRISDSRDVAKTRSWKIRTHVIREIGRQQEKEPSLSLALVCFSQQFARSLHITKELKQRRRRRQRQRQRERQKCNRFRLAKEQLCTCITLFGIHFFAVVEQLRRESA